MGTVGSSVVSSEGITAKEGVGEQIAADAERK